MYQSSEHGARPTRNLRPPGGEHRPCSAHAQVFRLGAERAAGRGYVMQDDSGSEEDRAARGPGREPQMLRGRGALTHWDGGGTGMHAMVIEGASNRRHEPTAAQPEFGLG